jgi:hypothetical protein
MLSIKQRDIKTRRESSAFIHKKPIAEHADTFKVKYSQILETLLRWKEYVYWQALGGNCETFTASLY